MDILAPARKLARSSYKDLTLKKLYPDRYRKEAEKPVVKGKVVFLEVREEALTDNFRLIRAALEKRNERAGKSLYRMSTICIREGMAGRLEVMQNCLNAIPKIADAEFIFVNEVSYFLSCLPIRPGTTVIQTWHACGAFKKFGYSAVGQGFGTSREDLDRYPVHRNFDYVTVSGPEVIWAYAEAFHMEDRREAILPIGVSRTDMFFHSRYRDKAFGKTAWVLRRMAPQLFCPAAEDAGADRVPGSEAYGDAAVRDGMNQDMAAGTEKNTACLVPGRKIILYAPTFRGSVGDAVSPDRLDLVRMKEALGRDHILLIKHHPFVKERPRIPDEAADFAFDMTDRLTIEELITSADICITDYSSIIFEYSLFERPLIFFAFDLDSYLDERGFYYPQQDMMPGPVCRTQEELIRVLQNARENFDLARVRGFKYRFMSGCDGHATARVLELMDRCASGEKVKASS
jgi:CDP-ribitol ribitolphosphotransferase